MLIATLGWGTYNVIALIAHEEYTEITRFDAAEIRSLDVSTVKGSVTVVGVADPDVAEVVVTAEISDGLRATGNRQEMVGDRLELAGSCPVLGSDWCSVDYELPRARHGLELRGRQLDDGSVSGLRHRPRPIDRSTRTTARSASPTSPGRCRCRPTTGSVEGTQLRSQQVTADADNGRVQLDFDEAPTTVIATTENGRVEVVVPDDGTAYRTDVQTDNGSATTGVPVDSSSERAITIRTENGSATARTG